MMIIMIVTLHTSITKIVIVVASCINPAAMLLVQMYHWEKKARSERCERSIGRCGSNNRCMFEAGAASTILTTL